ncbi:hypothetical protein F7725_028531 [Dissostichus mawsoni]|uniref:Uncharacterized protein n=1 Tax=Dissostichus mawsoni TaxID=36200 RepID=A0A7J5XGL3_DISMA|nr:hypothetical protein F7725_028531 [Dissostichus mawsoni]
MQNDAHVLFRMDRGSLWCHFRRSSSETAELLETKDRCTMFEVAHSSLCVCFFYPVAFAACHLFIMRRWLSVWQQETADGDQMGDKRLSLRGVVRVTLADGEVNTQRELPHTQRNRQGSALLVLDLGLRDVPSARGNECSSLSHSVTYESVSGWMAGRLLSSLSRQFVTSLNLAQKALNNTLNVKKKVSELCDVHAGCMCACASLSSHLSSGSISVCMLFLQLLLLSDGCTSFNLCLSYTCPPVINLSSVFLSPFPLTQLPPETQGEQNKDIVM